MTCDAEIAKPTQLRDGLVTRTLSAGAAGPLRGAARRARPDRTAARPDGRASGGRRTTPDGTAAALTPESDAAAPQIPGTFFAWDVEIAGRRPRGISGVTDEAALAKRQVSLALTGQPIGSTGKVRLVALSPRGDISYVDLNVVAQAHKTKSGITWA
ncbi:hypothetical protein SMC26_08835 [Actinomadura fulvescens]|uniref:Uncharacterized protein n=1 Tax=Actinomadura fulvescens TaxID=46160 RepID=A0ABP6D7Y3_9ACTN